MTPTPDQAGFFCTIPLQSIKRIKDTESWRKCSSIKLISAVHGSKMLRFAWIFHCFQSKKPAKCTTVGNTVHAKKVLDGIPQHIHAAIPEQRRRSDGIWTKVWWGTYCWWQVQKSGCHSPVEVKVVYPCVSTIINRVLAPSQVVIAGFLDHQQHHKSSSRLVRGLEMSSRDLWNIHDFSDCSSTQNSS